MMKQGIMGRTEPDRRTVGGCTPDPKLGRSSEGDLGRSIWPPQHLLCCIHIHFFILSLPVVFLHTVSIYYSRWNMSVYYCNCILSVTPGPAGGVTLSRQWCHSCVITWFLKHRPRWKLQACSDKRCHVWCSVCTITVKLSCKELNKQDD